LHGSIMFLLFLFFVSNIPSSAIKILRRVISLICLAVNQHETLHHISYDYLVLFIYPNRTKRRITTKNRA